LPAGHCVFAATTPHSREREEPTLLITDYDPKPLYYPFAAEYVSEFSRTTSRESQGLAESELAAPPPYMP
jgi:uncharacterized protein (DUF2249 family)